MTTWMSARNESALEVQPQRGVVGLRAGDQANSLHVAYAREVHDLDVSVVDCEFGEIQLRGGSDVAKAAKVTIGRNLTGAPTTTILLGALAAGYAAHMSVRLRLLSEYRELPAAEMLRRSEAFARDLSRRRTVRDFSDRPVPPGVIDACLRAAGTAPSGANLQPWHFVVITDPAIKRRIREAAEVKEREFYEHRAPAEWLAALEPLGTDWRKPFLEVAPVLIAVFGEGYG